MIYQIIIYTIAILFTGFYIGYIIYRIHEDAKRIIIARESILRDFTVIAENVEKNNRLLVEIIERKRRRYEDARK